jgi:small subunit ribosomal protein S19
MGRSTAKGAFVDEPLLRKVNIAIQTNDRKPIKTWSRRSTVTPDFVGLNFLVHNGKAFTLVYVTENMVGHRLGEFSPTRTFRKHGGVKKETTGPMGGKPAAPAPAAAAPAPAEGKEKK